ncbi:hypothetical protein GDO78_021352, partial [Eleutherodactylus coqui]
MLLYPDSQFGVARLEIYDWKDGTLAGEKIYARRAADRKVVRLTECIHVAPAPTESGYKENMAAFIIETSDKTMLLSAERPLCDEWVQRLSEVAFPVSSRQPRALRPPGLVGSYIVPRKYRMGPSPRGELVIRSRGTGPPPP